MSAMLDPVDRDRKAGKRPLIGILNGLGAVACLGATAWAVEITVIDFEDMAQAPGSFIEVGGFTTGPNVTFNSTDSVHWLQNARDGADNGSTYLALRGRDGGNVLTAPSEGGAAEEPFTLVSFELAENRTAETTATSVLITGLIIGGGERTRTVALDGVFDGPGGQADFQTVFLAGWDNLERIRVQAFGGGDSWYAFDNIVVSDEPIPLLLGDANNDLQVTGADLIAVQQNFAKVGPPHDGTLLGDANDDGIVTGADLIAVQQNFGKTLLTPVPEPAVWVTILSGGLLVRRRRHRNVVIQ